MAVLTALALVFGASVASRIRCRRLRAAIGSQRKAHRVPIPSSIGKRCSAAMRFDGECRPTDDRGRDTRLAGVPGIIPWAGAWAVWPACRQVSRRPAGRRCASLRPGSRCAVALPPRGPLRRLRGTRRARLRPALGATVGFLGCALALLDMLPQAPPKASSPQKGGKTRVAECDNPTLAYFLLRRKLLGNLPESVAFSSLACLGVESNP